MSEALEWLRDLDDDLPEPIQKPGSIVDLRRAVLTYRAIMDRVARLNAQRDEVVRCYNERAEALTRQAEQYEAAIRAYLEESGGVDMPDLGGRLSIARTAESYELDISPVGDVVQTPLSVGRAIAGALGRADEVVRVREELDKVALNKLLAEARQAGTVVDGDDGTLVLAETGERLPVRVRRGSYVRGLKRAR